MHGLAPTSPLCFLPGNDTRERRFIHQNFLAILALLKLNTRPYRISLYTIFQTSLALENVNIEIKMYRRPLFSCPILLYHKNFICQGVCLKNIENILKTNTCRLFFDRRMKSQEVFKKNIKKMYGAASAPKSRRIISIYLI